jgi:hypothetical protein
MLSFFLTNNAIGTTCLAKDVQVVLDREQLGVVQIEQHVI